MVYINFPPNLTEEEELLRQKYARLRKKVVNRVITLTESPNFQKEMKSSQNLSYWIYFGYAKLRTCVWFMRYPLKFHVTNTYKHTFRGKS